MNFHNIWIEHCHAAHSIRQQFGTRQALGYLVCEKLLDFLRAAQTSHQFAAKMPSFIAEIKTIFTVAEISNYLGHVKR